MSIEEPTEYPDTGDDTGSVTRKRVHAKGRLSSGGEPMYDMEGKGMRGVTQEDLDELKQRVTRLERENRLLHNRMSDHPTSREAISDEINKRVVLPLILATGMLLLLGTIGAFLNGGYLVGFLMAPGPLLAAWILWRSRDQ